MKRILFQEHFTLIHLIHLFYFALLRDLLCFWFVLTLSIFKRNSSISVFYCFDFIIYTKIPQENAIFRKKWMKCCSQSPIWERITIVNNDFRPISRNENCMIILLLLFRIIFLIFWIYNFFDFFIIFFKFLNSTRFLRKTPESSTRPTRFISSGNPTITDKHHSQKVRNTRWTDFNIPPTLLPQYKHITYIHGNIQNIYAIVYHVI